MRCEDDIEAGDSVQVHVDWTDYDGVPVVPTRVEWGVIESIGRAVLHPTQIILAPTDTFTVVVVPASALMPTNGVGLIADVLFNATFSNGTKYEHVRLNVRQPG